MDETIAKETSTDVLSPNTVESPEGNNDSTDSPKTNNAVLATTFTIDFGEGKTIDSQRHKSMVEKYQKRHRRGQSASKLEEKSAGNLNKAPISSRKSSSSIDGYGSSSEDKVRSKSAREKLSLPLKNTTSLTCTDLKTVKTVRTDRMVQSCSDSFPSSTSTIDDDNELELGSFESPSYLMEPSTSQTNIKTDTKSTKTNLKSLRSDIRSVRSDTTMVQSCVFSQPSTSQIKTIIKQLSSPECELRRLEIDEEYKELFVDGTEYDFERSEEDAVSEAGTYTLDTDNYSREQKERMSIDREFKIEMMQGRDKAAEYVNSLELSNGNEGGVGGGYEEFGKCLTKPKESKSTTKTALESRKNTLKTKKLDSKTPKTLTKNNNTLSQHPVIIKTTPDFELPLYNNPEFTTVTIQSQKPQPHFTKSNYFPNTKLSPILSPTQNMSITDEISRKETIENNCESVEKFIGKISLDDKVTEKSKLQQQSVVKCKKESIENSKEFDKCLTEFGRNSNEFVQNSIETFQNSKEFDSNPKESLLQQNSTTEFSQTSKPQQSVLAKSKKSLENIETKPQSTNSHKTFTKIMFPTVKSRTGINEGGVISSRDVAAGNCKDLGSVISVTSSGAFRQRNELQRKSSLTKSDIYVEAYTDNQMELRIKQNNGNVLSANLVHVCEKLPMSGGDGGLEGDEEGSEGGVIESVKNLPPLIGGKTSPSKIPSPIISSHNSFSRPRSRNSNDLSDSSLETECYLKPTQQLLNSIQQRLDNEQRKCQSQQMQKHNQQNYGQNFSQCQTNYGQNQSNYGQNQTGYSQNQSNYGQNPSNFGQAQQTTLWNNEVVVNSRNFSLLKKPMHTRHNSLDERTTKISNKLEHFQNKNLFIDNVLLNQYNNSGCGGTVAAGGTRHKIQNSPNNSPIRRSSSFSTTKQQQQLGKCNLVTQKEVNNARNSPSVVARGNGLQKSASTTNIKPLASVRRSSITSEQGLDHRKIDRSKYGDTESSSEDDLNQHQQTGKKKDITNTRYNRAFSLRRARLEEPAVEQPVLQPMRCPNTPEMRRKFQPLDYRTERAISVDRKPNKSHDVPSRYLQQQQQQGKARHVSAPPGKRDPNLESRPSTTGKVMNSKPIASPGGGFSRNETGRFSMRGSGGGNTGGHHQPKLMTNSQKTIRKEINSSGRSKQQQQQQQGGPRCNSSLSSREVEFQNWKRRKSYDPMKAAAEGKKRVLTVDSSARKSTTTTTGEGGGGVMTQSMYSEGNNHQTSCDSSPSHSSSVHRSQSFHGTAANLGQLISSEEEEDLTLSADEGFSPPTPSPSHNPHLRYAWKDSVIS